MTEETSFRWMMLWVGALITGVVIMLYLRLTGFYQGPLIVLTLGLAALIGGGAWLMYRAGNREMAFGLVGGYGFMALVSAGQCTLYVDEVVAVENGGRAFGEGAIGGFFLYLLTIVASLVIGAIVLAINRRRRREGEEPQ